MDFLKKKKTLYLESRPKKRELSTAQKVRVPEGRKVMETRKNQITKREHNQW